ncbi:MAG TPA: sensor domain-containing diguanylate cyclase [Rhodocyclaceae bacterium]|nr:sensor domain-containing diguanylate cyclase [Rhodocyclaceae bacterium]
MLPAPIPANEDQRIESLRRMLLLATPDEEAFDRVTRMARRVFGVPIALVSLVDANRQWFKSCYGLPVRETGRDVSFCGHAIMGDELFVIPDATQDERFADNPLVVGGPRVIFYAGRPLKNSEGYRVGTLCVIDHAPRDLSDDELDALDDLGHWVEQVFLTRDLSESQLTILRELDEVRRSAMLDPMLNIWHRGAATELITKEVDRLFRNEGKLAIMMIDVDNFKEINDSYGHPVADQVLIQFVHRIQSALRSYDMLGRYGGDEFVVAMPNITSDDAATRAQTILNSIQFAPVTVGDAAIPVSASIGLAATTWANFTSDAKAMIDLADQALLRAKRNGRGRIEVS